MPATITKTDTLKPKTAAAKPKGRAAYVDPDFPGLGTWPRQLSRRWPRHLG